MPDQTADVVRQAYGYFQTGNIEALLGLLSDDVIWRQPEIPNAPFYKNRQGRESVSEFFAELGSAEEVVAFEPREFVAEGDRVVALGSYRFKVRATGREYASEFTHVFGVGDGKITAFQEYMDTAAVNQAFAQGASSKA